MAENVDYFIPPEFSPAAVLADELPGLPANACDAFIRAHVPDGGLVWDPFCRTDAVARSAARHNKRAFLSDFNPLIAFTVRAALNPVSPRQLDRAFAALAAAPTLQATLETHLSSLYATTCPVCGAAAIVRTFTWSLETHRPTEKEFHCLTCNQMQHTPVSEEDLILLAKIDERGRAYWTLLDRLSASDGVLHALGERLLDLYTARSIYAFFTIQNTLEMVVSDGAAQEVLMLALLHALQRGMKQYSDGRAQHRSGLLHAPAPAARQQAAEATFVETNCWFAFADACAEQRMRLERESSSSAHLRAGSFARAPSATGAATASVRTASPRRVAADLGDNSVHLILTAPPLIDWGDMLQLSYLWTGWVLGKDEARRFSPDYLLHPRRANDWAYLYTVMEKNLAAMAGVLAPAGKLIMCMPLSGLGNVNVICLAAAAAGLQVENVAYQPHSAEGLRRPLALGAVPGYCYMRFVRGAAAAGLPATMDGLLEAARRESIAAAQAVLAARAESAAYIWLHLAALQRLSTTGILARLAALPAEQVASWDRLRHVQAAIGQSGGPLSFVPWTTQPEPPPAEEETVEDDSLPALARQRGWWRLSDDSAATQLSDRVEWAVYTVLSTAPLSSMQAINRVVYALFPGLCTPDPGLIDICVQSYAAPASPIHWQLRPDDALAQRSAEHTAMITLLARLGRRLGFDVWIGPVDLHNRQSGPALAGLLTAAERYVSAEDILPEAGEHSRMLDVIWYRKRRASHLFEIEWTAMLGEGVLQRAQGVDGVRSYMVVPGARAGLIEAKMERLPLLRRRFVEDGWAFLRFESLRELAGAAATTAADLDFACGLQKRTTQEGQQLALW